MYWGAKAENTTLILHKASITRRDISTLLRNGDIALARVKGHNLGLALHLLAFHVFYSHL